MAMHPSDVQVMLITADDRLRRTVRAHQPPGLSLHCTDPREPAAGPLPAARELWIDLDSSSGARELAAHRRVYLHSGAAQLPADLPPGLFVRKPCADTVIHVLWAGVSREPASTHRPARAPTRWLPQWLLEFHELGLRDLCKKCVRRLGPRFGYADVSMYLYDAEQRVLTLAEATHPRPIDPVVSVPGDGQSLMAAVARSGRLLVTRDAPAERAAAGVTCPDAAARYPDTNCLIAPLVSGGRLWGVLNFSGAHPTRSTEVGIAFDLIFSFIGKTLRYARAYDRARTQARVDALTGLFNNRWMIETLTREIRLAQRSGSPLAVIVADLDGLKLVNDRTGHRAGDYLLRHVSRRITAALRQSDSAARVGGDEFVALLPATDLEGARSVARRMLESIRSEPAIFGGISLPISASLGVAQWRPDWDVAQLLEAADQAMYQAKRQGRDRLMCNPGAASVCTAGTQTINLPAVSDLSELAPEASHNPNSAMMNPSIS